MALIFRKYWMAFGPAERMRNVIHPRLPRRHATPRSNSPLPRIVMGAQLLFGLLALGFGCTCGVLAVMGHAAVAGPYGVAGMFFLAAVGALERFRKAEDQS